MQSIKKFPKPVKLKIYGDYWDSQIYNGKLYLWTMEGTIKIINWDTLIASLTENPEINFALKVAFNNGLSRDVNQIKLMEVLSDLSREDFIITENELNLYLDQEINMPLGEHPIDVDIFDGYIYCILDSGLWRFMLDDINKPKFSKEKLWDCFLLSLKIRQGGRISLSAGHEGLFEYNFKYKFFQMEELTRVDSKGIFQISSDHSLFTNWSYSSIYNSSDIGKSFLAGFTWDDKKKIKYKGNFYSDKIFKDSNPGHLSWGSGDKIYRAKTNGLDVIRFTQNGLNKGENAAFSEVISYDFHPWKGRIIGAGATFFGTIIECENALVILQSNEKFYNIRGPITNWRVFNHSNNYENQLHILKDDNLEVYSFINQAQGAFGVRKRWKRNNWIY